MKTWWYLPQDLDRSASIVNLNCQLEPWLLVSSSSEVPASYILRIPSDYSQGCLPQPGTKLRGEGILRMEDVGTSEEDDIDSQDSNTTDHGHLARNCSIKILKQGNAVLYLFCILWHRMSPEHSGWTSLNLLNVRNRELISLKTKTFSQFQILQKEKWAICLKRLSAFYYGLDGPGTWSWTMDLAPWYSYWPWIYSTYSKVRWYWDFPGGARWLSIRRVSHFTSS